MKIDHAMQWLAVFPRPTQGAVNAEVKTYHGDGDDIILQGFHWESHRGGQHQSQKKSWYQIIRDNAEAIKSAGFTWLWFPPSSDSLSPQGYIPRRWYGFDTPFGSEAELRTAISAIEPVRAMADLVLNHRVGVATSGADFADPSFLDNRAAIVRDDESGVGTGNPDTGERHPCGRDLDHTNPDVRAAVIAFLRRLKSLGFRGWRYDLAKGFHGRYIGEYNDATAPLFSVGEYFDGDRQKLTNWIDTTGGRSTAFDFPTRYILYEACQHDDYSRLRSTNGGRAAPGGLIGFWPSRAVTFIDNHDTEFRRESDNYHEGNGTYHFHGSTVEQAYAYTLTHPGTPCIFWSHFFDWGQQTRDRITALMKLRKDAGLHYNSVVDFREAGRGLYAAFIDGRVAVKLGSRDWSPGGGWHLATYGERFAAWIRQ